MAGRRSEHGPPAPVPLPGGGRSVSRTRAPDADHEEALRRFDEAGFVAPALLVRAIDAWNRAAVGFRSVPPVHRASAAETGAVPATHD